MSAELETLWDTADVCTLDHKGNAQSRRAFDSSNYKKLRFRVLHFIWSQGVNGATADEALSGLRCHAQSVHGRFAELKADGWIREDQCVDGERRLRKTSTGNKAAVCVATESADRVVRELLGRHGEREVSPAAFGARSSKYQGANGAETENTIMESEVDQSPATPTDSGAESVETIRCNDCKKDQQCTVQIIGSDQARVAKCSVCGTRWQITSAATEPEGTNIPADNELPKTLAGGETEGDEGDESAPPIDEAPENSPTAEGPQANDETTPG